MTAKETTSQLSELMVRSLTCLASVAFHGLSYQSLTLARLGLGSRPEFDKEAESYKVTLNKCLNSFMEGASTSTSGLVTDDLQFSSLEVQLCIAQSIHSKVRL